MQILIVAATDAEMGGIVERLGARRRPGDRMCEYSYAGRDVHLLVTGVGMVATAAWCSRALGERSYDLALNAGLCGSFDESLAPGTVVHVVSDCLAELGAEDGDRFLTLQELGLEDSVDSVDSVDRPTPALAVALNYGMRRRPLSLLSTACQRPGVLPSTPLTGTNGRLRPSSSAFIRRSRAWKAPRSCMPA